MVCQLHTFLFADLVGFTRFTVAHGDERAAQLAISFQERVSALAAARDCQLVKTIGDAVLVRSDNCHVAVELGASIHGLAARLRFPQVRVGIDTGHAVERDDDWFGSTVNTASRVSSAARPGEVLVTERTREACAAQSELEFQPRGVCQLGGLPAQRLYAGAHAIRR